MSRVTTEFAFVPPDGFLAAQDALQRHWISSAQYNSVLVAAILHSSRDSNDLPAKFSVVPSCNLAVTIPFRFSTAAGSYYEKARVPPQFILFPVLLTSFFCSNVFLARYFDCKEWSQTSWGEKGGRAQQERRSGGQGELLGKRHVPV